MNDPIIRCVEVSVGYGRQEILHKVTLEIPRGSFLPFTGPNGSGKTTLLRAILGLLPLRHGRIEAPFSQTPAGYVPQQKVIDPLYPVSARQIVEMGLHPRRRWLGPLSKDQRQAVDTALEQLGMADHAGKTFRELSGGMKQKILIARAFVCDSDVIIMDEPTSELDEQSEKDVLDHLLKLHRHHGKTVLMAHHDLDLMAELTDSMCRINHGKAEVVKLARQGGSDA